MGAVLRYGLLDRLGKTARRQGLTLLAFGLGDDELRLVVEGPDQAIGNLLRGVKVGTVRSARAWGVEVRFAPAEQQVVDDDALVEAVVWAHRAPIEGQVPDADGYGPLASPWSSHRDLLGFRKASFYDAEAVRQRVDPSAVHQLAGGTSIPDRWPPEGHPREPLTFLLRVAAALVGVLPADRRSFRLFVHLAKARGWATSELADALMLTTRRVRQLAEVDEPLVELAMVSLGDARLCVVP